MKCNLDLAGLAAAALLAACGGGSGASADAGTPSTGSGVISGAASGALTGMPIAIGPDAAAPSETDFVIQGSAAGILFEQEIALDHYAPAGGTYTSADAADANGTLTVGAQSFGEIGGDSAGTDEVGGFTLQITSAGTAQTASGVTRYLGAHGTFTGTYALDSTAGAATATVTVTF